MKKFTKEDAIQVASILKKNGEIEFARIFSDLASVDREELFLKIANTDLIWGGAGSVCDQAFVKETVSDADRLFFYSKLVDLGSQLLAQPDTVNPRVEFWVSTLSKWLQTPT